MSAVLQTVVQVRNGKYRLLTLQQTNEPGCPFGSSQRKAQNHGAAAERRRDGATGSLLCSPPKNAHLDGSTMNQYSGASTPLQGAVEENVSGRTSEPCFQLRNPTSLPLFHRYFLEQNTGKCKVVWLVDAYNPRLQLNVIVGYQLWFCFVVSPSTRCSERKGGEVIVFTVQTQAGKQTLLLASLPTGVTLFPP